MTMGGLDLGTGNEGRNWDMNKLRYLQKEGLTFRSLPWMCKENHCGHRDHHVCRSSLESLIVQALPRLQTVQRSAWMHRRRRRRR